MWHGISCKFQGTLKLTGRLQAHGVLFKDAGGALQARPVTPTTWDQTGGWGHLVGMINSSHSLV